MLTNTGVQTFDMCPPKSVVVGIDGSQAAVRAARWAVDEVADTETPLRLLYSRELNPGADRSACHRLLAAAEDAVYDAYAAVETARAGEDTALDQQALDDLLERYDTAIRSGIVHNWPSAWDTGNHPGYALGA